MERVSLEHLEHSMPSIPSVNVIRVDSGPGPMHHESRVRATFDEHGATDAITLRRANGISMPVAGGVAPFRDTTLRSDDPSAKTSDLAQLMRAAAEHAGGVQSIIVDDAQTPPVVKWGPQEGAKLTIAPWNEAPSSVRDVIAAADQLARAITGGALRGTDPTFAAD